MDYDLDNLDINSLSNEALAKCLKVEFAFDCGPVTASTRSVYTKKLSKLIEERKNSLNHQSLSNNNNSFDNYDDKANGDDESHHLTNNRLSSLRQSSVRSSPRRKLKEESTSGETVKQSTPKASRRITTQMPTPNATPKSNSRKSLPAMSSNITPIYAKSSTDNTLSNYSSESSENEDVNEVSSHLRKSPRRKQTSPTIRALSEKELPRVPSAGVRAYPSSTRPSLFPNAKLANTSLTRPPLRRTLASTQSTRLANYSDSEDADGDQNDKNIRERLLRHRPGLNINSITTQSTPSSSVAYEESNFSSASNWISYAILIAVFLFFVFILSFYFYSRLNSSPKSVVDLTDFQFVDERLIAPVCDPNFTQMKSRTDNSDSLCLNYKTDIMPALKIVKQIKAYIDETLFKFYCDGDQIIKDPNIYKISALRTLIFDRIDINSLKSNREGVKEDEPNWTLFGRDFVNALTLIQLNTNWQMVCEKDVVNEVSQITLSDNYQRNFPMGCHIKLVFKRMFWQFCAAFAAIFVGIAVIWYVRRKRRLVTEEQDLIYDFVEKSLELLQSPDNPQSMPVLHIRDTLFTPAERKTTKYKRIWDKVVKLIETTESRVKVEMENIEGEDFKTWKWMAANPNISGNDLNNCSPVLRTGGIEWQGQAFGQAFADGIQALNTTPKINNGRSAANFAAPTEFLKIRNMFDKESILANPQNWKIRIRNAILEKIAMQSSNGVHGIVHIEIEEDSHEGLVYLKCSTIQSATDAFNALNGWWCEKKLVSVKFLKADRYYQRFPNAANAVTPLTIETA